MTDTSRLVLLRPPSPKRKGKPEFSVPRALERADQIMALPCAGHLPRVPGRGTLLHRFVMPLELCSPENRHSRATQWQHAARKDELYRLMWVQCPTIRPTPLAGRAMVRMIRFSAREADNAADGFKTALDFLCVPRPAKTLGGRSKRGFGFLVDDAPRYVERVAWWERAKVGEGFALLEIWSG